MELKTLLSPIKKYWWLLVVSTLLSAISSFAVMRMQPPTYVSKTTLVIGRAVYEANPNSNDFWLSQQLASFYIDVAQREPVRNGTMAALGLNWLPEYSVRNLPGSQLLEIAVLDTSPVRAQVVANELAKQLMKQTPTDSGLVDQSNQEFITQQLTQLRDKIKQTQDDIDKKNKELGEVNNAQQILNAQQEISVLETKLSTLQNNYALLLTNSKAGASNTLTVIEVANFPTIPNGPNAYVIVLLSSVLVLGLSTGVAVLLEYLDDTLKTANDIMLAANLPVIGNIAREKDENILNSPLSYNADAFRALRTNLEFFSLSNPIKSILISSAGVGEGKTYIAINLAIALAQIGKKVILVDADLRRPRVHLGLEISNDQGLGDVFLGRYDLADVLQEWGEKKIKVITSGCLPPNPFDLLGSFQMDNILNELRPMADFVIIDGPPLMISDSLTLSTKVDGVILIIRHGYTRKGLFSNAVSQIKGVGARILGVIINQTPPVNRNYYSKYYRIDDPVPESKQENLVPNKRKKRNRLKWIINMIPSMLRFK